MTATSPFLLRGKAPAAGAAEQPFWVPSHVQHQPAADRTERRLLARRMSAPSPPSVTAAECRQCRTEPPREHRRLAGVQREAEARGGPAGYPGRRGGL